MKKYVAFLLAALALLSLLVSCGKNGQGNQKSDLQIDETVTPTWERVISLDAKGEKQYFGDDLIYDYYTFEGVDSESIAITGFYSQTQGKNTEEISYVRCLEPHAVIIPQTLAGKTVVRINDEAFRQHDEILYLGLPETLTYIGKYAFEECSYLQGVTLPASVAEIGQAAFYRCTGLRELNFAPTASLSVIPQAAFMECESLEEILLPGSIKTVEKAAFLNCTNVTSVTLNEGLETIGDQAFQNLNLAEKPVLPSTVKTVGEWNFE